MGILGRSRIKPSERGGSFTGMGSAVARLMLMLFAGLILGLAVGGCTLGSRESHVAMIMEYFELIYEEQYSEADVSRYGGFLPPRFITGNSVILIPNGAPAELFVGETDDEGAVVDRRVEGRWSAYLSKTYENLIRVHFGDRALWGVSTQIWYDGDALYYKGEHDLFEVSPLTYYAESERGGAVNVAIVVPYVDGENSDVYVSAAEQFLQSLDIGDSSEASVTLWAVDASSLELTRPFLECWCIPGISIDDTKMPAAKYFLTVSDYGTGTASVHVEELN